MASLSVTLTADSSKGDAMSTTALAQTTVAAPRWSLDADGSSVGFTVKTMWGLIPVRGRFERFAGSYEVGPDGATIELTIDADSIDTGNAKRDAHLRSSDFFDAGEHAQVRFRSTRVDMAGDGMLHIVGNLEIAGIVEPLEFAARVQPAGEGFAVEATTIVDQRRFGMSSGLLGMIRGPATLHVKALLKDDADLTFRRARAPFA
jgi:polyisoprenoid-binding protein YceI